MTIYMVYEKYNKDFLNFAKSIARNHDEAFDLVQEAYLSAMEKEEVFEYMNEYQVKGWFFTTIKNKNIDRIRKEKRLEYQWEIDMLTEENNFEERIIVQDLLKSLPKKLRNIVGLRYHMNLNSREIGDRLNISPSTVRSQLSKALQILRKNI